MSGSLRHRLRIARRVAWYAVAVTLVLMALAAGAVSQLLPLAERNPERIADWLSARAGRTVAFDRVETEWTRRGPLLRVDGLRIGEGDAALPIGSAEILVSQYAGLLPGRSFTELRLRGLALTLQRGDDGRWQVRGLPGQERGDDDPLSALQRLGELQVIGGRLTVLAPSLGVQATLPKVDVRLRVADARVRVALRAWMRQDAAPATAVLDFDRVRGDGRAYVVAWRADLAAWSPLLRAAGIAAEGGRGRTQAWADLRGHRIVAVTVDAALDALRLRGAPLHRDADASGAAAAPPRLTFRRVEARARWRAIDGGWRLDAPRLRLTDAGGTQTLDGLAFAGGTQLALRAQRLDAGPLFAIAALSDRLAPDLRDWLLAARPGVVLHDVRIGGRRDGAVQAQARVENLRFASVGDVPGLSGLGGTLQGDRDGAAFDFDPRARARFDWPRGFGAAHEVALRGRAVLWRQGGGWQVQTPALRIDGDGYGARVRGGLWLQNDGTRPAIDLVADLDDAAVPVAKRFWVRHRMPPPAVRWLDAALLGGQVRNGRAVVSGDLDDWPFRAAPGEAAAGLFRAEAELDGAVVKFQPDWPATDRLDGRVVFAGNGFAFEGDAVLAGVAVREAATGIADFGDAELRVRAEVADDAGKLLALLRQSPLQKQHGDTLRALRASGPAQATFALALPLRSAAKARPEIDGRVRLDGARLEDPRWKLAFAEVRGEARYDQDGFTAEALQAVRDGQPGSLSLRAGNGHVRDPRQAFEAELAASLAATELIERAPELAWLAPHLSGRSPWTVALAIPKGSADARASGRLQLRSDLVGTRLRLPAPLDKPASVALPTTVETGLPPGEGEISVALGQRLALRARSAQGRTGVRVALGSDRVAEAPPASGLIATGRAAELDALDWMALAGGRDQGGDGLPLQRIDIAADRLLLIGGAFADARLRALPAPGGTAVQFEGPALAGSLLIPQAGAGSASAARGTVAGRLQRLHWRSAKPPTPADADIVLQRGAPSDDDLDPAQVPALNLVVDDLRFGEAALGSASLQARPIAGGLRIERLQTRAPEQRLDLSGEWTGRGASARTRLQLAVDSGDFGALLAGLGFGGRIDDGEGEARFEASWPGSPAGFRLDALTGSLSLTVKDGRLVEIEPGAGRVLGLLSVAELPRRLTLDFRDFFEKGFAFNRIGGNVRFGAGAARSDDLVIDGPAAEIRIRGSADLRAQTFDQTIDVLPKTGNLLTAVGALTGGPVGAAVGAVANAVLKRPLGEINARTYRVTGPWKDPKVEVAARVPPQAASGRRRDEAQAQRAAQ